MRVSSHDADFAEKTGAPLKKFFKSSGDHRQIDGDIKKITSAKKEYVYVKETKDGKTVIKINGKVQVNLQLLESDKKKFVFNMNGQRFIMNPELSYANHKSRLSSLLNPKQSVLESFLIREAYSVPLNVIVVLYCTITGGTVMAADNMMKEDWTGPEGKARVRELMEREKELSYDEATP